MRIVRAPLRYVLLVTTGVLGGVLPDGLVTRLLPVLGRSLDVGFNVFDVMHHGLHEKQISNVFRWLLESEGTHGLGDRFVRIFIDEVNRASPGRDPLPHDQYWVRQEVNTAPADLGADIADLVLESSAAVLVVENYLTSDGHGHSYDHYVAYAQRDGRRGVVVLLCRDEDASLQTMGWENAAVLTYATLVDRLHEDLADDHSYRRKHPDAHSFIDQMHRKFVKGRGRMEDSDVLGFVVAMCANERDPNWQRTVDPAVVDYSHVFLSRAKNRELRQSAVTLHEVLDGLEPTDRRLHDEIVRMLSDDS